MSMHGGTGKIRWRYLSGFVLGPLTLVSLCCGQAPLGQGPFRVIIEGARNSVACPATAVQLYAIRKGIRAQSGGGLIDLSRAGRWSSSNTSVASVDNTGKVTTTVNQGASYITFTSGPYHATTQLINSQVASLSISPLNPSLQLLAGLSQFFTATANLCGNAGMVDVTASATWSVDSANVAKLIGPGIFQGVSSGSTTVHAAVNTGLTASTGLNVGLTGISVAPTPVTVPLGATQQLTAMGTFGGIPTLDISSTVNWSSNSPSVSVSNTGLATAVNPSQSAVTVTASSGTFSSGATLTISAPKLQSISVPRTRVLTGGSPVGVAINPSTHKVYVVNLYSASVTVIDGVRNTTATVSTQSGPDAVAVNPVTNKIYVANNLAQSVTVIDGATNTSTTVSAGSSPDAVAVNPVTNKIYVVNKGSNDVTVIDGANNSTATVSVGALPRDVVVNPVTNKIYVTNFNSNTVTVIDGASNTTSTVSTGNGPLAVAVNTITNKIYVTDFSSRSVTVIDGANNTAVTVNAGINPDAVAVNTVTDKIYVANFGSSVTVIDGASNATAAVNAGGNPYAVAVNQVSNKIYVVNRNSNSVTVIDGATNSTTTVATDLSPNAVAVDPATDIAYVTNGTSNDVSLIFVDGAAIQNGGSLNFSVRGTYSDGGAQDITRLAIWNSSNSSIASVKSGLFFGGVASGDAVNTGTTQISAAYTDPIYGNAVTSPSVSLMVVAPALESITLTPANTTIVSGNSLQFTATGHYSNNTSKDLTTQVAWSSSMSNVATITQGGLSTGTYVGATTGGTTISATLSGVSGSTLLTVTAALLTSITVAPSSATINQGSTQAFTATGNYSGGSPHDITGSVVWKSSLTNVTIDMAGVATGLSAGGPSDITASQGSVMSNIATLTVTAPNITSIVITPAAPSLAANANIQFTATATFSAGSPRDITQTANWSSSMPAIADVDNSTTKGYAVTNTQGSTTISASQGVMMGSATLTVSPATLLSINIVPLMDPCTLPDGTAGACLPVNGTGTLQYTATGSYSDGSALVLTSGITWSSNNPNSATISNSGLVTLTPNALVGDLVTVTASVTGITPATNTFEVVF